MEKNRFSAKLVTLAILLAGAAVAILWIVSVHSSGIVSVSKNGNSHAPLVYGRHNPGPLNQHAMAPQHEGDSKFEGQTQAANCARGFIRRGSMCEGEAKTLAGSNPIEQRSLRPPERE
jgi:hypothetical protein